MEDVDVEKPFLEEKIAEMRDRRDVIKTLKPIPAASRDSVVDTMHIASNFSKKGEPSLRIDQTTTLQLEGCAAMY